ncbi:MAG: transposase [Anaerolineae bacterium]|nr:transposase [Anaerolineae bacterium]
MGQPKRESQLVIVARIGLRLAQAALPQYAHLKSPHTYTLPQLVACVLLKVHQRKSYRDTEELLLASSELRTVLELSQVPDYSTLQRTYKKLRMVDFERMNDELLRALEIQADYISSDGTGFALSTASAYYRRRRRGENEGWLKGVYAVDVASLLIVAMCTGRGPSNDIPHLETLRRRAMPYGRRRGRRRLWVMLADAGFDGRTVQATDLIPPMRRHGKLVDPTRIARKELVDQARLDGLYGQRWKSETVNSVIKRKFGSAVFSVLRHLQRRDAIIKGLVYNIHR